MRAVARPRNAEAADARSATASGAVGLGALGMEGAGAEERALGQGAAAVADFAMEPKPAIALSGEVCGMSARMMLGHV